MASASRAPWIDIPPVLEKYDGGRTTVLRDDLLEGGSKLRFLPFLVKGAEEIVYGGPFCGGAAVALSVLGRYSGQKITLFYAKRKVLHQRQQNCLDNGATIYAVKPGYMNVVQKRARDYASQAGALFLPLGFDTPEAEEPFVEFMLKVRKQTGTPDEVWCASGSGMLARCLARAFPDSEIHAVAVGLKSRWSKQSFPDNIQVHESALPFNKEAMIDVPFSSCGFYERKAWSLMEHESDRHKLFWNVLGDDRVPPIPLLSP